MSSGLSGLAGISGLIGSIISLDPDALAFINAAGLVSPVHVSAIDNLVKGLKINGTWSKYIALYPLIGGTAFSHSFNLKDPRNLDAAYRVAWNGTLTHNAQGVTGGGGFGDTFCNLNSISPVSAEASFSSYLRSQVSGDQVTMGARSATTGAEYCLYNTGGRMLAILSDPQPSNYLSAYPPAILGLVGGTRQGSVVRGFLNGTKLAENANATGNTPINSKIALMGQIENQNNFVRPFFGNAALFSISRYFTESEIAADYNVIQQYQTTLDRAV